VGGFVFVFANVVFFSENQLLFPQKRQARQKDRQKRQGQTEKTDETDETDETITGETEGDRINETSPTPSLSPLRNAPFSPQKCCTEMHFQPVAMRRTIECQVFAKADTFDFEAKAGSRCWAVAGSCSMGVSQARAGAALLRFSACGLQRML
jgi:hypothetical protein